MRTFEARYPGRCGECGTWFEVGEEVKYVDDVLVGVDCCSAGDDDDEWWDGSW